MLIIFGSRQKWIAGSVDDRSVFYNIQYYNLDNANNVLICNNFSKHLDAKVNFLIVFDENEAVTFMMTSNNLYKQWTMIGTLFYQLNHHSQILVDWNEKVSFRDDNDKTRSYYTVIYTKLTHNEAKLRWLDHFWIMKSNNINIDRIHADIWIMLP